MPLTSCSHISQGSQRRLTFLGHSVDMLISSLTPSLYSALSLTRNVLILSLNQTNLTMDFPYLYQFILPRHTQRRDRASGVPLEILKHLPPNQSLPTFCFVLSPTPLTLRGAVPHYLSLKKELAYSSS